VRSFLIEIPDLTKSFSRKRTNCLLFNYDDLKRSVKNISGLMNQIGDLFKPPTIFVGVISRISLSILKSKLQSNIILAGSNGFEIDGPGFAWAFPKLGLINHQLKQLVNTIALEIGQVWTKQNVRLAGMELSISIPPGDQYISNILSPLVRRQLSGSLLIAEQSAKNIRVYPLEHWDKQLFIRKIVDLLPHESGLSPVLYYFGAENSDEPAFRETNLYGYSVLLRENIGRKTNARYYLRNTNELNKLLLWLGSQ